MERALLLRLDLVRKKAEEAVNQTKEMVARFKTDGVTLSEINRAQVTLTEAIKRLRTDLLHCLDKLEGIPQDLVIHCTNLETEGEEFLVEVKCMLQEANHNPSQSTTNSDSHARLPRLELPKFDGDILKWNDFWDQFQASVHNKAIPKVEKLLYLLSLLKGTALEAVEGLATTNDNYDIAIDTLTRRYGSKHFQIDAHYEQLNKMEKASHTPSECRKTLDKIEKILRVLQSLGENIDNNHLRLSIMNKFPDKIVYELNLNLPDQSVRSIRNRLEYIVTAMELSQRSVFSIETEVNQNKSAAPSASTEALYVRDGINSREPRNRVPVQNRRQFLKHRQEKRAPSRSHFVASSRKRKWESDDSAVKAKKSRKTCIFCSGDHFNDQCTVVESLQQRKAKLGRRCFICFKEGHGAKFCKQRKPCYHCTRAHNRALCPQASSKKTTYNEPVLHTTSKAINTKSWLQTATVTIKNNNKHQACRLLLDSGSQRSYLTARMARRLKLDTDTEDFLMIYTFGSEKPTETTSPSAQINLITKRGTQKSIRINIVQHITDRVPTQPKVKTSVDIMADDDTTGTGIDLLIGNDYYFSFMRNEMIQIEENLYMINTDFGWMLSGSSSMVNEENTLSIITYCQCDPSCPYLTEPDLPLRNIDIKFLWTLEGIGITDSPKSNREEDAVKHFNETVVYQEGRYFVKWPWTQYPPDLPTNFGLAYGRLKGLCQRLDRSTLQEYSTILKEQLDAAVIETIEPTTPCQTSHPVHYLPHHIVKQKGKKSRIVYDASAKMKNQNSLNECMFRGPCMLEDLTALLLSFRTNRIGVIADVEKAFLQVGLQTEDRDVTRFLWLKDPKQPVSMQNLLHLRFCRVPFGVISSPFLLTATIRYHLSRTNNALLSKIADKCYVDNLVTGVNSRSEACALYVETRSVFQDISMNIREWTSNDKGFINQIPEQHRMTQTEQVKVLGLIWSVRKDTLQLNLNKEVFKEEGLKNSQNKKGVLKTIASFYDPCGYVTPLILPAKILLQQLWEQKYKWDTTLSVELNQQWNNIVDNLRTAKQIEIPRYVGSTKTTKASYELHCFTDASKNAYAAAVYLRVDDGHQIKIELMMSKSRLTPIQEKESLKIPRLELLGLVIGSRLLAYVKNSIDLKISKQYLWTDSIIVLSWMKSNKLLPPFVARRVEEVKRNTSVEMCYINTKLNPADIATRPELWHKQDLWFHGPQFLTKEKRFWPDETVLQSSACVAVEGLDAMLPEVLTNKEDVRSDRLYQQGDITVNLDTATHESVKEIRRLQAQYFPEETQGKQTHLTRNLGLFFDVDGILRCRGRMTHTEWSYDMKHPILIPKDSDFTNKIIREAHINNYHVGVAHTLSIIRQLYWIPQGRAQVQRILKKCPQCIKHSGGPYKVPQTPALPAERVNYTTPFTYTGIDYFGPLFVNTSNGKEKRWVCLFTCLAVRAIHLEIVRDLSAEECLLALRRFIPSRGLPKLIVSDNALQFKLTSEVLSSSYCIQQKIQWKFIPQLAPWHGGFYERLVGLVKHCLKRTLEKHLLRDNQLSTIMKEVEAVINTRPLTCVSSDLDYILKPADFLTLGKCLVTEKSDSVMLPYCTVTKQGLIESWRRGLIIISEFKNMFVGQYLQNLREKYKQSYRQPRVVSEKSPCIGDIVQIKDDSKNRVNWKVGKITSLVKGSDGQCRVAKVKVGATEFTRSIGHLYPLEAEPNAPEMAETVPPAKKDLRTAVEQNPEPVDARMERLNRKFCALRTDGDELLSQVENNNVELDKSNPEHELEVEDSSNDLNKTSVRTEIPCQEQSKDCGSVEFHYRETELGNEDAAVEAYNAQEVETIESRTRRAAAIKAREKIAEWTRQLIAML